MTAASEANLNRPDSVRPAGRRAVLRTLTWATLAVTVLCAPRAAPGDWPTHRGNAQRTGAADDQAGPKAPKVLWVYKSAEHFVASPTPGAKAIYTAALGAFNTGAFHAISTDQQAAERVLWSRKAPYIQRPTVCGPAVVGNLAVFGDGMHQTDDALLYCVRTDTGLPVWQYAVPGKLVHLEGSPTIDKGRVHIGGGAAGVLCLDMKRVTLDGKEHDLADVVPLISERWSQLHAAYERARKQDPALAVPPNADALPKLAPKLIWQAGKGTWHVDAPVAVAGDKVLAASAFLDHEKVGKRALLCLNAADGSVAWQAPLQYNPWAGPTVAGKVVLVGCSSIRFDRKRLGYARGEVVALDLATGKELWRHQTQGGVLGAVAVKGDLAVYTSTNGTVVALTVATGRPAWTYTGKKPFFASVAVAGQTVYAADLAAVVHSLDLADGKPWWTFDVGADRAVQTRTSVYGSPVVAGGNLYLATCNLDGQVDQPSVVVCISDASKGLVRRVRPIVVDNAARTVIVPATIAPRKLPTLKEIYPLEVIATSPAPHGQKAHETVVTFDAAPSDLHKALVSLGLAPGKPARGHGAVPTGPEVRVLLEYTGITGKARRIPIAKALTDSRTGKRMPPMKWYFTGSVMRQADPDKPEKVYGADLSGTLISLFPVTDETVLQSSMTLAEESLLKMETNKDLLPPEGTDVKLIVQAK